MTDVKAVSHGDPWAYLIYIVLACAVTAGLNIVHSKYILGIELTWPLFIVPALAGIIFGWMCARLRTQAGFVIYQGEIAVYAGYIAFSCFVTTLLNVVHTEWVLHRPLEGRLFIAPTLAGVFFGFLIARIKTLNRRLTQLASTDGLTKAWNRMQFDLFLAMEIDRVQRYGGTFSLIYFDVDNFKDINDRFGHAAGDAVLAELASLIKETNRRSDLFARYGGEEFVVLIGATSLTGAIQHAERLRLAVDRHMFPVVGKVTCSFGVVEYQKDRHTATSLLKCADQAMYHAKSNGRNRVERAGPESSRVDAGQG